MKIKKVFALVLMAVMVATTSVLAVNIPETLQTTATININKVLTPSDGVYPDVDSFEFTLTPVSYTLAEDGNITDDPTATYMPAGGTIVVDNLQIVGDQKEGSAQKILDFSGKKIGVYTYSLQEVNKGVTGVTYDDTLYYVNVYVINQVDENNVPTGATTISNITAWRGTNMSDEALKGMQQDTTGLATGDEDGKIGMSTNGAISYPFENSFETSAEISLTKTVKGNYANKEQLFTFDVNIDGGVAGDGTYDIVYTNVEGTETAGLNGNPATITTGETATIKLKHGENFVIKELPASTEYTIVENQDATYSATYTADGEEKVTPDTATGEAPLGQNLTATGKLSDNGMNNGVLSNEIIEFINTKEYTAPTGIILNILPFVCGVAIIGVVYFIFTNKKQEE